MTDKNKQKSFIEEDVVSLDDLKKLSNGINSGSSGDGSGSGSDGGSGGSGSGSTSSMIDVTGSGRVDVQRSYNYNEYNWNLTGHVDWNAKMKVDKISENGMISYYPNFSTLVVSIENPSLTISGTDLDSDGSGISTSANIKKAKNQIYLAVMQSPTPYNCYIQR